MKRATLLPVMLLAAAFAGNAEAVFKCTTSKGVVYQDRPCREGTETDVQIVVPTGELAPKAATTPQEMVPGTAPRTDAQAPAPRTARTPSADPQAGASAATGPSDRASGKESRPGAESTPMTAEQARKTDPSAKYYTTDAFSAGGDTPEHMTCESPSGEKRRFLLTGGKLTSI